VPRNGAENSAVIVTAGNSKNSAEFCSWPFLLPGECNMCRKEVYYVGSFIPFLTLSPVFLADLTRRCKTRISA
jgi:hypothetical protein